MFEVGDDEFDLMLTELEDGVADGVEPSELFSLIFALEPDCMLDTEVAAALERGYARRKGDDED